MNKPVRQKPRIFATHRDKHLEQQLETANHLLAKGFKVNKRFQLNMKRRTTSPRTLTSTWKTRRLRRLLWPSSRSSGNSRKRSRV
ncbi:uncharacterized protein [Chaetodon trifascialis]|uniref:uncharacterized protein isoform X1 n=1 Tax=Chaetodon trifascialis TaxID=109706 RepID=UPI003990E115